MRSTTVGSGSWAGVFASFLVRSHKVVVLLALVLAVASALAASRIRIKTQLKDMLPADDPKVASLTQIAERFQGGSSVVVLLEGTDRTAMARAAEDFVASVKASPDAMRRIRSIRAGSETDFLTTWGLLLQEPKDIRDSVRMFDDANLLGYITSLNELLEEGYTGDEATESLETDRAEREAAAALSQMEAVILDLTRSVRESSASGPAALGERGAQIARLATIGDEYTISPDGSLLLLTIVPSFPMEDIASTVALIAEVRRLEAEVAARHPGVELGYAGDIASNADEQDAVSSDMLYPALVAYVAVLLLFLFSFDSLRSILFTLLSLIGGILYNYGVLALTLGSVNMLTSIMGALLVGMGIDYGIQVTTSYGAFRSEGSSPRDAILKTFTRSGKGILLAAVTTAASFYVFAVSSSKALREFGFVAGTGIGTCFLAMVLVLPSLLLWFDRPTTRARRLPRIDYGFLDRLGAWSARHRVSVLRASLGVALAAGLAAVLLTSLEYDMMELQPSSAPSYLGYRKLLDRFGINPNTASVALESVEEARALTERLEDLRGVAQVSSVAAYLPADDEQAERLEVIRKLRAQPPVARPLRYDGPDLAALRDALLRLEQNIVELGDLSVAGLGEDNRIVRKRNQMVREVLGAEVGRPGREVFRTLIQVIEADPEGAAAALRVVDQGFAAGVARIGERLLSVDRRIDVSDLPESVIREYFDETGTLNLLTVYPSDAAVSSSAEVVRFVRALDRVGERISGVLPLSVLWMEELVHEAVKLGAILAVLVFLAMLVGFRSLRYALVASVPLCLGLLLLFGLVGVLGVQLSGASLAVTPMVIGIGIAYGTYMTQRYLVEGRDLGRALRYTAKAVLLSAATTMAGFGSLWLVGSYRAISSLGAVLFLGITATLLTTLIVLPALLGGDRDRSIGRLS